MKAVVCRRFGRPDEEGVMELAEVDDPQAGPGQIVVDVKACAVNFPDLLTIQDLYQFKPGLPFIPGSEVAGVVRDIGPEVRGVVPGDRIIGSSGTNTGGLAEQALLQASTVIPLPAGVDFGTGAGLFYAYGTSHHALKDRAVLEAGETLLVLGGAGAVGLAAIELGHLAGARVIAAASSDEKLELCREYGAEETVNYETEDLKTRVRELTSGEGANVVYDPVGGKYAEPALRATAWGGRYLVIGFASGEIPRIPLNLALLRGCDIVGVFLGAFVMREPDRYRQDMAELVEWWQTGKLRPHVSRAYPLDEATRALQDIAARRVLGKVIVTLP